jgi:hypothetical protein
MSKREKVFNVENEEFVLKEIDKLQPLNYNRFLWWRRFTQKKKPLSNSSPLLDKIKNGDLSFSHYWWQIKFTEMEINSKLYTSLDNQDFIDQSKMDRVRRGRLIDDFVKDENGKLDYIRKEFSKEFRMTVEDYDNEVIEFGGTLDQFYNHCSRVYTKKLRSLQKQGRPKKI